MAKPTRHFKHFDDYTEPPRADYYIGRKFLNQASIGNYYSEHSGSYWTAGQEERSRIHNKVFVATRVNMQNLRKKGYIEKEPDDWGPPYWRWTGYWLTQKGIELARKLLLLRNQVNSSS